MTTRPKILNLLKRSPQSSSETSNSEVYRHFRSIYSQKKVVVDEDSSLAWTIYDAGPREITSPLIFLPPASGTADIFFLQVCSLAQLGYRLISLSYPVYWTIRDFVQGFLKVLDHLLLDRVHVFGASLGGFLAQKVVEATVHCPRIESIILCNSFADTTVFNRSESAILFWMVPFMVLKKMILSKTLNRRSEDRKIQESIEFMQERLNTLTQAELASRLTLNCVNNYIEPEKVQDLTITIIDVFDQCGINQRVRDDLYKLYPKAKRASLKTGGNFPFLSRPEEVNMHIVIHLRQFEDTRFSSKLKLSEHSENIEPNEETN